MRVGFARLTAGLLGLAALSALRPADLEAAGNRVTIFSPKAGSTIWGTVAVRVTVTGEPEPDYLILRVDQERPYSTNCLPYSIEFDTTRYPDGTHYLWAEAYTRAALIGASERVTLVVSNRGRPASMLLERCALPPPEPAGPVAITPELAFLEPSAPMMAEPNPTLDHILTSEPALSVVVMGRKLRSDVAPWVSRGRVLVGFRAVFEHLDTVVHWQADKRMATARRDGRLIEVTIGSKIARVDGKEILLDTPAHIRQQRTIVPLRFCGDSLGYEVAWRSTSRRAELYSAELSVKTD